MAEKTAVSDRKNDTFFAFGFRHSGRFMESLHESSDKIETKWISLCGVFGDDTEFI